MRVTKVRHSVTDTSTSTADSLLTAWEARYNANNMMVYEGYWYGTDTGGAADSPTGVNLFFHDERNLLVKAIYNAKVDGYQHTGITIAAAEAGVASLGASNNLQHTDRQVYDIRNTGGRRAVNWYRAMPTPATAEFPPRTTLGEVFPDSGARIPLAGGGTRAGTAVEVPAGSLPAGKIVGMGD